MTDAPERIRSLREQGILEIAWTPARKLAYPFHFLRCECPCASCVNEFTGEKMLDPDSVPGNIFPAAIEFSGNYALRIEWSDGHNTGLYSWDHLDRLGQAPDVGRLA